MLDFKNILFKMFIIYSPVTATFDILHNNDYITYLKSNFSPFITDDIRFFIPALLTAKCNISLLCALCNV